MTMLKAKIVVIGPRESGKTVLSNFLSDTVETVSGEYHPTQGVRILEFESQNAGSADKNSSYDVELWDCSGDFKFPNGEYCSLLVNGQLGKFESCWPAFMEDSNGVVIVFNPDIPSHLKEVEAWHSVFLSSQGLQDSQGLLIAHHKPGSGADHGQPPLASHLSKLPLIHSNLEEEPEDARQAFWKYLESVVHMLSESREREEMSIIT